MIGLQLVGLMTITIILGPFATSAAFQNARDVLVEVR